MKPWIKHGLSLSLAAALSACAVTPSGPGTEGDTPSIKPKVELPADYAAALAYLRQERWGPAESALKVYAENNPGLSSPQVNLALLYKRTGRDDLAQAALTRALEINPNQAAAYNLRGVYAREAGEFEAAQLAYEKAIEVDPQYPNAYLNLAILHDMYLHQVRRALPYYERYAAMVGEDALDQNVKSWIADAQRQVN